MSCHPTSNLPLKIFTAKQVRALDVCAIEKHNISGYQLMEEAGNAVFCAMRANYPESEKISIICGHGNNGGDGYIVARLAQQAGLNIILIQVGDVGKMSTDASQHRDDAIAAGLIEQTSLENIKADVVIDALLGTGIDRAVSGKWLQAIESINAQSAPVISIDIPSGLHADTGAMLGEVVQADICVTFIGLKPGLLTAQGPGCCGRVLYHDLNVPAETYSGTQSQISRLSLNSCLSSLPARNKSSHKGNNGHVLIIGGAPGFSGAVQLAAEAALRSGAGLVSIATHPEHSNMTVSRTPECMCHAVSNAKELKPLLDKASVLVIGPGLGQSSWASNLLSLVLQTSLPVVFDADALNLISKEPVLNTNAVYTPHPGEAARMLGCTTQQVEADRFASINNLQKKYGGCFVLKGAGSLVKDAGNITSLCNMANPAMATGGMGDVLSGIIAALIAQGSSPHQATKLAVCVHACAAEKAAGRQQRGLLAHDIFAYIPEFIN